MSAPLTTFETDLLHELRANVAERAERHPTRHPGRRRAVLAAGAGALVAAVGGVALTGGSPAFAVESSGDGGITIRIHELTDAQDLEAALAERDVAADVDYAGSGATATIGQDGRATVGEEPAAPDGPQAPADSRPADSTFAVGDDCGPTSAGGPPIALERDGADYVVTLAGATLTGDNDLRLTTMSAQGHDSLVASYSFSGSICGAMVSLP